MRALDAFDITHFALYVMMMIRSLHLI